MNPFNQPQRCIAIVLIYSLVGQAVLAGPLQQLPANTIGFVTWDKPVERDELKQLKAWVSNLLDTFSENEEARADVKPVEGFFELLRYWLDAEGAIGLVELATADGGRELYGVAKVRLGPQAAVATQVLERLFEDAEIEIQRVTIGGQGYQRASLEDGPNYVFATQDGLMTMVIGGENIDGMVSALQSIDLSIADSTLFKASQKKVADPKTPVFTFFIELQRLFSTIQVMIEDEADDEVLDTLDLFMDESGLGAMQSIYLTLEAFDLTSSMRIYIATEGEREGLLRLWDHEPLKPEDIALIPEDARYGMAAQFDAKMFYDELMHLVRELSPEAAAGIGSAMGAIQGMTNISLPDDLLPALGDTWVLYDSPQAGGFIFTGLTLAIDVRDQKALREMTARIVEVINGLMQQSNGSLEVMSIRAGRHKIDFLVFEGLPVPFAPAACFIDDRVILGLSPQVVKLALAQADSKTRKSSVLDHPDIKPNLDKLPKNTQSFYYADNRTAASDFYWLTHMIATASASIGPTTLHNPGTLPTLSEKVEQSRNAFSGWAADEDGFLYVSEGTLFPTFSGGQTLQIVAVYTSVLLPSLFRARELAKRAVSRANLRGIGQACYIYANDHNDQFPKSLDELVEAGVLSPRQLESPRQSPGVRYVYIPQTIDDDVRNVLGYEMLYGDEGTAVLFLDGHVQWMREGDFRTVLAATASRLGRELEVVYGE